MTSYLEENHPPLSPNLTAEYFASRLDEAQAIADQNDRFGTALDDPIFESDEPSIQDDLHQLRQFALEGISTEQADTIKELSTRDNTPYKVISSEYETTVDELTAAEKHLAGLRTDPREIRLRLAAERAIALAPWSEPAATQLATTRIESIQAMNRHDVELVVARLGSKVTELGQLHDLAGTAWPVPKAIGDVGPDILVIDEIPLDPESHITAEEEAIRKLIERHGSTYGASILLTAYLMDNIDVVFTPDQLGHMLYQDESHFDGMNFSEKGICIRKRIQRLLLPDARVGGYLEDEGMYLQYGYRRFLNPVTRFNVRPKRRIYRAAELQDGIESEFEETILVTNDGTETREDGTTWPKATVSTTPGSLRNELLKADQAETTHEEILAHIDFSGLVTALWGKNLLPRAVDGTISGSHLKTTLIRMGKQPFLDGHNVSTLKKQTQNIGDSVRMKAHTILAYALDIDGRYFKDDSLNAKVYHLLDEKLAEFYESQASDEAQ